MGIPFTGLDRVLSLCYSSNRGIIAITVRGEEPGRSLVV